MARGWESKSVEEQATGRESTPHNTDSRPDAAMEAARKRERQALELQRERILDERTSNPHRRAALEAALADIELKLSAIS
jgi:hypothetical protein